MNNQTSLPLPVPNVNDMDPKSDSPSSGTPNLQQYHHDQRYMPAMHTDPYRSIVQDPLSNPLSSVSSGGRGSLSNPHTSSLNPMHHFSSTSSGELSSDITQRPSLISVNESSERSKSNSSMEEKEFVRLARRRASKSIKEKANQKKSSHVTRPQGRPLSKETRIRLTLVPTLGILYSTLVSDNSRKALKLLKYQSTELDTILKTNEEMSTKNVISGFSSLLNVQQAKFMDHPPPSPGKEYLAAPETGMVSLENRSSRHHQSTTSALSGNVPEFDTIDDAVYTLFGLTEYSLIRITRAAATEVGGSVLLKIETAMPGYLYLNDDEEEDFKTVELNKDLYQESIGSVGDRPSTTFLKKRVVRPRYKSDMRIYLVPRSISCAIYCEKRIFKRDLIRGFLDLNKPDRSIIVAFDYEDALKELREEGYEQLISRMGLPAPNEVKTLDALQKSQDPQYIPHQQHKLPSYADDPSPTSQEGYPLNPNDLSYGNNFTNQSQNTSFGYRPLEFQQTSTSYYDQSQPSNIQGSFPYQQRQPMTHPNFNPFANAYVPPQQHSSQQQVLQQPQQIPPHQPQFMHQQYQVLPHQPVIYPQVDQPQYVAQPSGSSPSNVPQQSRFTPSFVPGRPLSGNMDPYGQPQQPQQQQMYPMGNVSGNPYLVQQAGTSEQHSRVDEQHLQQQQQHPHHHHHQNQHGSLGP